MLSIHTATAAIFALCVAALPAAIMAAEGPRTAAEPYFLVATPEMPDPTFAHAVILMLPPGPIPIVVGLIINKPTAVPVSKLFPKASGAKSPAGSVHFGGPVGLDEPSLLLRRSVPAEKALRLFDDVYLATDPGSISELLKNSPGAKDLRLFLGRAQWTRNQLHAEIQEGSWYTMPAEAGMVFSSDPERLWRTLVERGQLLRTSVTCVPEANAFALFPCADALPAEPPNPILNPKKRSLPF